MSQQQPWDAPSRGGSVKRARERAAAGKPTEPIPTPRPYDPTSTSNVPSPPRARLQGSPGMTKNDAQSTVGLAISRPTRVAQWPLMGTNPGPEPQQYQPPPNRGPPPQRPPRPSHVPSILDSSRIQDITPTFQYQPQQLPQPQDFFAQPQTRGLPQNQDDSFDRNYQPLQSPPLTSSSRQSTVSSVGTIPDFPVPIPAFPPSARRSTNLGPPPTARRGASSYYSQISYVSPIPEVSEGMGLSPRTLPGSHSSYASSAAIPSSWGPESPGFYRSDEDEDDYEDDRRFDTVSEGRESRASDDNDDRGLIRSASIGKRARPSMIVTRSSGQIDPARLAAIPTPTSDTRRLYPTPLQQSTLSPVEAQRSTQWPMPGDLNSPLANGTGLLDPTPSNSDESVPTIAMALTTDLPSRDGTRSPNASAMLGAYQAASALPSDSSKSSSANDGQPFSRLSALRRPPRLNIDAVREAESRGSLTSLPDLIRRATRLASMIDRGKRPASRMGLDDFPSDRDFPSEKEIELSPNFERRGSTLSGMLSAFPPPGRETPARDTPRPLSTWPEYDSNDPKHVTNARRQRKCCGLPCWGFVLVIIILLIIIATAVVVPLKFLVIDKHKTNTTATATPVQICAADSSTACKNGGTSYFDNGVCSCICTNGFTGSICTVAGSTGCTTTSSGTAKNMTIGDSIPRLISAAQTNFSIPLFENTILARFNAGDLSCASENSLVTFDGSDERMGDASAEVTLSTANKVKRNAQPDPTKAKIRALANSDATYIYTDVNPADSTSQSVSTSAVSAASTSVAPPSTTSSPSTTKTTPATLTTSTIDPTAVFSVTQEVLDFARVTVLFVLQQENLDNAITAQTQLQKFFNQESFENLAAMNISMGGGNTVNLVECKVDLGNGTIGQKNSVTR
ncbi:13c39c30-f0e1-4178-994b-f8aff47e19b3 [Sclerotinia trifoliorum]|uniref:13c39c30-f0e1-4178-994b-f8aff47e19b3 n=1 Tax=Sclerotinia trifoliorum TaxID=28548 RepID=A0A8H2ZWT8_9HELO|nr:13c39c30-f0e1-4178-994b-f8aff47e19b3 [Sclerotinia trifoliorum]